LRRHQAGPGPARPAGRGSPRRGSPGTHHCWPLKSRAKSRTCRRPRKTRPR
jgi:hypothetical protein